MQTWGDKFLEPFFEYYRQIHLCPQIRNRDSMAQYFSASHFHLNPNLSHYLNF